MTKDAVLYRFKGKEVRVVIIEGEPWFVAKDVCDVLGVSNVSDKVRKRLAEDELHIYSIYMKVGGRKSERKMLLMSESGLYKFLMRSDKPEAREFQDWVTREVLPSIRKTGGYSMLLSRAEATREPIETIAVYSEEITITCSCGVNRMRIEIPSMDKEQELMGEVRAIVSDFFASKLA